MYHPQRFELGLAYRVLGLGFSFIPSLPPRIQPSLPPESIVELV
jgi:hypothetical protein